MSEQGFIRLPVAERPHNQPTFSVRIEAALAKVAAALSRASIAFFDAVGEWRQCAYERRLLADMDSRARADIGLDRLGVPGEQIDPSIQQYWRGGRF